MKSSPFHALASVALVLALAGCAAPASVTTGDPVVTDPSTEASEGPQPKPTAAIPSEIGPMCFEDLGLDELEQHGGEVFWPAPLGDDDFVIEPSCWSISHDASVFIASWYGITEEQMSTMALAAANRLEGAGWQLDGSDPGIAYYSLFTADNQLVSEMQVSTSTDPGPYLEIHSNPPPEPIP